MAPESELGLVRPLLPRVLEDILRSVAPSLGVRADHSQCLNLYDENDLIFLLAISVLPMRQQDVVGESVVHAPSKAIDQWVLGPTADGKTLDMERCAPRPENVLVSPVVKELPGASSWSFGVPEEEIDVLEKGGFGQDYHVLVALGKTVSM